MGSQKTTEATQSNSTQTVTPDPSLVEQNKLGLEREKANQQGLIDIQGSGLNLGNLLLRGMDLPGYLQGLPGGIDEDTTNDLVAKSLRDINPYFQQSNLLDSGVRASVMGRTAGDIRLNSKEWNLGNLQSLLSLALGGQAQIQQPVLAQSAALGQRLAGLSSVNNSGNSTQTNKSPNPFWTSFQQSAGKTLGSPSFGFGGNQPGGIGF